MKKPDKRIKRMNEVLKECEQMVEDSNPPRSITDFFRSAHAEAFINNPHVIPTPGCGCLYCSVEGLGNNSNHCCCKKKKNKNVRKK